MRTQAPALEAGWPVGERPAPEQPHAAEAFGRWSTLAAVSAFGVSSLVGTAVLTASGTVEHSAGRATLHLLTVAAPVATGLYAARSGYARFGRQLMAAGFVFSLTTLAESSSSLLYSAGRVVAWAVFPLLFYLLLAFPDGRIVLRRDRVLAAGVTGVVTVLYVGSALLVDAYPRATPWATCDAACPPNAFQVVAAEPAWAGSGLWLARDLLSCLLLIGVTAALGLRLRTASVLGRVTRGPVVAAGMVTSLLLVAFIAARRIAPDGHTTRDIGLAWTLCLPAIAAAFSFGLMQRRLLVSSLIGGLTRSLRTSLEPPQIGGALRASLGDTAAEVLTRDPDGWVREDGATASLGDVPGAGRRLREIRDGSVTIAAVEMDEELRDDELVDAVVALVETALHERRLQADLELSLHHLDDSRQRIATAADVERRRIERDLHDGAQQRLIALRMRLSLAEDLLRDDPVAAAHAIRGMGDDVDQALEEIRSLAHGIYPALLADRGLADALRSVARRTALRVDVRAAGLRRLPAELETAVYFTCREALQNAAKHAGGATRATVELDQGSRRLTFEVTDNGDGFDPAVTRSGFGLRNMGDRIESVGGVLKVFSAPGEGVTVSGTVPLPSRGDRASVAAAM